MKKRINLFSQRALQVKLVDYNLLIKKSALSFLIFSLISFLIMFLISYLIGEDIKVVKNNSLVYQNYVLQNRDLSGELEKFIYKYQLLQSHLSVDAKGSVYYEALQGATNSLQNPPLLSNFTIDITRNTTFTADLPDYDSAIDFMESLETSSFQELFETLKLDSFNLNGAQQGKFTLNFSGIFIDISNSKL